MRITLHFDSATTEELRAFAKALNRVDHEGQLRVGLNGPEHWHGQTPPLSLEQLEVVRQVIRGS